MKPNLIVIMADQLRYDALGMGFTPNIDKLASESVVFERAYSACPLCVPARGAFFTGKHPSNNGSLINPWEEKDAHYGNVKAGIENLYELVENDWESIHSGKQHLYTECGKLEDRVCGKTFFASTEKTYKSFLKENGKRMPGGERFRTYVPEMVSGSVTKVTKYSNAEYGCYDEDERFYFDEYFTDCAVRALRNRKGDKPLFLSAMYLAPHPPLEIPEPWYSIVGEDDFSLPDNVGRYYPYQSPLQMYNLPGIVGSHYTREHWKKAWRVYLGEVALLDDCVGKLISELKREGIYDDSIIIFTSDHGEMLGSHALFQKMCMYEEAVRVPLYIKYAFEIATKEAPDLKHIINCNGLFEQEVWDNMKKLVMYLRGQGYSVDGVGWQAHVSPGWEKVPGNIERLGAFIDWCHENNLEFHITELNIWSPVEMANDYEGQAETFTEIVRTLVKKRHTGVVAIDFWYMRSAEEEKQSDKMFAMGA